MQPRCSYRNRAKNRLFNAWLAQFSADGAIVGQHSCKLFQQGVVWLYASWNVWRMMYNMSNYERESLNKLMNEADLFAKYALQTKGKVPTTLFIHGENGIAAFAPRDLPDERSKDEFAALARMACVAHGADATVLVSEAWMKIAKPGEKLDLSKAPSQYKDKQEMVVMMGQTRTACQNRMLPMLRSRDGKFLGFGNEQKSEADRVEGRFANFIPEKYPPVEDREMAREVLSRMGVEISERKGQREERGRGMEQEIE